MSAKVAQPRKRSQRVVADKFSGSKKRYKIKIESGHAYERTRSQWKRIAKRKARRDTKEFDHG